MAGWPRTHSPNLVTQVRLTALETIEVVPTDTGEFRTEVSSESENALTAYQMAAWENSI